jgi:hypothetical protein
VQVRRPLWCGIAEQVRGGEGQPESWQHDGPRTCKTRWSRRRTCWFRSSAAESDKCRAAPRISGRRRSGAVRECRQLPAHFPRIPLRSSLAPRDGRAPRWSSSRVETGGDPAASTASAPSHASRLGRSLSRTKTVIEARKFAGTDSPNHGRRPTRRRQSRKQVLKSKRTRCLQATPKQAQSPRGAPALVRGVDRPPGE